MYYPRDTTFAPEEQLKEFDLLDYTECFVEHDLWYAPPVDLKYFERVIRSNTHHGSALELKENVLASTLTTNSKAKRSSFKNFIAEYIKVGNAFAYIERNNVGKPIRLHHLPALYMRVGKDLDKYYFKNTRDKYTKYDARDIVHLKKYDLRQEIYGTPSWYGAVSPALLSESATLFRRKYYKNGAHAGFLFYMNNSKLKGEEEEAIRHKFESMRGLGNFKNMFINGRGIDKEPPQLIPVGQLQARDEFSSIKNISRDEILAANRVPLQLMSIVPENVGGFGNVTDAAKNFVINEIEPLQQDVMEINEIVGEKILTTKEYKLLE